MRALTLGFGLSLALAAAPALAQEPSADALYDAMRLGDILSVMREEGLVYAAEVASTLFPASPDAAWGTSVDLIYDLPAMEDVVRRDFASALEGQDVGAMLAFLTSEPGATIVDLEVAARKAMLDDTVEEAAKAVAQSAALEETARYALIRDFVEVNDLIETNVVGAMNSNFAFYQGLADGGALPQGLEEDRILADVWAQEEEIRTNTTEWVISYLMLAYEPLTDADVAAYTDFSRTPAGQALNRALFQGFDRLFVDISRNLGRAAAQQMVVQEL